MLIYLESFSPQKKIDINFRCSRVKNTKTDNSILKTALLTELGWICNILKVNVFNLLWDFSLRRTVSDHMNYDIEYDMPCNKEG